MSTLIQFSLHTDFLNFEPPSEVPFIARIHLHDFSLCLLLVIVFDDGDEKTLRRSSLCLKGERHFAESEVKSSSSSSDEDEDDRKQTDELLGKVVCVDCVSVDKKKNLWFPALVVCPDCSDEIAVKKDNVLVRSFKDGKFSSVPRKDVREINDSSPKPDATLKQAFDHALEFHKNRTVPSNWKTELKEESSSSEAEEEEDDEKEKEDSSEEEARTPINKRPVLGYRNLNLFKLFRLVHKLGGFDNVMNRNLFNKTNKWLRLIIICMLLSYFRYLYGFEEYCTSANIEFKMELPAKITSKPCKDHEKDMKKPEEAELNVKEIKVETEEKDDEITTAKQHVATIENENERKENDKSSYLGNKKGSQEPHTDQEKELRINKTDDEENMQSKDDEKSEDLENQDVNLETEEGEKSNNGTIKEEDDEEEEAEAEEEEEEEEDGNNGEEEFECYPPGMKVQVRYGRGKNQKMYEASIKESDIEGGEVLYLVHYCGWNVRYDEWIKADKIVRPADKNVPKIKHRKKIKNKTDKEKDEKYSPKTFKLRRSSKPPFHASISPELASKPDSTEAKASETAPNKSLEIISILNGLQASESSDDSEPEDDQSAPSACNNGKEEPKDEAVNQDKNELCPKEQNSLSFPEDVKTLGDATASKPVSKSPERLRKESAELSDDTDYEGENEATKKKKEIKKEAVDKTKPPAKRGKRRYYVTEECLKTGSPNAKDEKSNGKDMLSLENSSNSSSDEEEVKNKSKTPSKKYNGLDDKRKSLRTNTFYPGFSEVAEKRVKLLTNSDERLQNTRAKDRKDVWSSIQGQWPKKTLKELFSDSDTEAAASPPHASPEDATPEEHLQILVEEESSLSSSKAERPLPLNTDTKPVEEKPVEMSDKKVEFPSSGSNSVLNTPPTTPESPPSVTVAESSRHQSSVSVSETLAPNQEEVRSIKSESDSTIEVDSVVGELQDLQSEGNISPTGFDASVSSSSSNQQEHTEKASIGQKRLKDAQGGSSSKKQKRSHKTSVVNNKKKSKSAANSSDSEDLSAGESIAKTQSAKSVSAGIKSQHTKSPARTQSPGKCGKNGEKDSDLKEQNARLPKLYKWSFQMSDLENMTSTERIAILQEKLQEIRKHYLSLKSEVASIDRRRKRLKKKERESAATTSSSSSSPSSSSITAAVMLSLADPPMSNSSQNGMSVECR
ncbi:hypothetical protein JD844_024868 [Phrynosoma platyrhinos]|uniref:ARID domain-containing protein n=1 Tax=Phrynosoma platyrhinos TaxID=52577 RepID=A0ABQ7SZA6_PHRPL|nr:hypothetical protein JD844_024868 [Phrynosoma platyrhinos]